MFFCSRLQEVDPAFKPMQQLVARKMALPRLFTVCREIAS